jgi:5-formyltetrahydrofolate cyclo-ligase
MPSVELRDIVTPADREAVLGLRRAPGQERYLGSMASHFEDAADEPRAMPHPWAVHDATSGELVGFAMISDGIPEPLDEDLIGPYYLWRLLIDERFQGRGYGHATIDAVVRYLAGRPDAQTLFTSCADGEGSPKGFYLHCGFRETGVVKWDEEVFALDVPARAAALRKPELRRRLLAERRSMPDREARAERLGDALRVWLSGRRESVIGAYWPIRGEFDPLPVLGASLAGHPRRAVGLPVIDPLTDAMTFHAWWPGCPMTSDRYGIPTPDGTELLDPQLLLVPCLGFGPGGVRLGYGGGYYDRTLGAMAADARPATLGIAFAAGFLPELAALPHDIPLDGILTEDGPVA